MARNLKAQQNVFDVENIGKPIKAQQAAKQSKPQPSKSVKPPVKQSIETPTRKSSRTPRTIKPSVYSSPSKSDPSDEDFVISIEVDVQDDDDYEEVFEATTTKRKATSKANAKQTPKRIQVKQSAKKHKPLRKRKSARNDRIQQLFKSGAVVEPLPGRSDEFSWIKRTVSGLLESGLGGCLYISGVPGTGKTATTHRTLDFLSLEALNKRGVDFDFVEINGMRLSDPGQAYSILAAAILPDSSKIMSGPVALKRLEAHFKSLQEKRASASGRPCIVLLDELDLLLKKKQSMLYHFFEWPHWHNSQLIVITIANTMDLPERFLSNRISSRLGLTRYNFKPYDFHSLANIIEHQLKDYVHLLGKDAIQLCARKVAAVSGDARRAVNFAKRAVDYFRSSTQAELLRRTTGKVVETVAPGSELTAVNLRLMDLVLKDALTSTPVQVISHLPQHQKFMLLSVILARKSLEEGATLRGETRIIGSTTTTICPTLDRVMERHFQFCRTHQLQPLPSLQDVYCIMDALEASRLVRIVRFREAGPEAAVQLLVHEEDVKKGLADDQSLKKYLQ